MTTPTGSLLVSTFERAWNEIQKRHPEVPDVVFITGGGQEITRRGVKITWGHFHANRWTTQGGKAHELFVSGESLTRPAHETMQTLLHEAAHALGHVREIQDASPPRYTYHNKQFVALATEMGLAWPEGQRFCPTRGYSDMKITDATRAEYAETIKHLDTEKIAWRELLGMSPTSASAPGGDRAVGGAGKPRSRNTRPKAICACDDGSAIYLSRKVLAAKGPICGVCHEGYRIHPDYE